MLVSPLPNYIILLGFVCGGVVRGLAVGLVVTILATFFADISVNNIWITVSIVVLTSILFSLAGFINAVFAESFDDISIIPTFVLTPLIYLGGVFYSIDLLPEFWANLSQLNPILYMVNGFRYGILGVSDINISWAFTMIIVFIGIAFSYSLHLLNSGKKLRT
jgi:ABC-2 type transport system permease protein